MSHQISDQQPHDEQIPGLRQLQMRRAPSHDLWPGIQAQLRPRRRQQWAVPLAMAASVLLTVGLAFNSQLLELPFGADSQPASEIRLAAVNATALPTPPTENLQLSSTDMALVKANLQITQIAERQLLAALESQPRAEHLHSLLESTRSRQQQLRILL